MKAINLGYCFGVEDGKLIKTVEAIKAAGVNVAQFYAGKERSYFPGAFSDEDLDKMAKLKKVKKYVHLNFLVNIGVAKGVHRKSLHENLKFVDRIKAEGLIVHVGTNDDSAACIVAMAENLEGLTDKVYLENMCGGARIDIVQTLEFRKAHNTKFCFDTAHAFGGGMILDDILYVIENEAPDLVHLNNPDKSVVRGSGLDRHNCSIYNGALADDDMDEIIAACCDRGIPMVLETGNQEQDYWDILKRSAV